MITVEDIARLINEDIDDQTISEENYKSGDKYEDAWVLSLKMIYPFVHRVSAHLPGEKGCAGCWDSKGVDIFYSESTPTYDPNKDLIDKETIPQAKLHGRSKPIVTLMPKDVKPLQVKAQLADAIDHIYKWHQLISQGKNYTYIPVVIGMPPINLDRKLMQEIETKGFWLSPKTYSEKSDYKILKKYADLAQEIKNGERDPLDPEELNKIKKKPLPPAKQRKDESFTQQDLNKIKSRDKETRRLLKLNIKNELEASKEELEDLLRAASKSSPSIVDEAANIIDTVKNLVSNYHNLLNQQEKQEVELILKQLTQLKNKISDKVLGRVRKTKTGTKQQPHVFKPRMLTATMPLVDKSGKIPCIHKDSSGKTCNNAPTHKSHFVAKHNFSGIRLRGKREPICKTCFLRRKEHNSKQQTSILPESNDFVFKLDQILFS